MNLGNASTPPRMTATNIGRRDLLKGSAVLALAGLGYPLLAACGSDSPSDMGGAGGASWTYQMVSDWNFSYLGEWAAVAHGHYDKAGIKVSMVPGSTGTTAQVYVSTGHGDVSLGGGTVPQADAFKSGLKTKIIGALYNKNPRAIVSLASKPISTIDDLYGKTIGVPPNAQSEWNQFVKTNNVDVKRIKVVAASFDVGPLAAGTWDGMQGLATNQPAALKGQGIEPHVMLYADFGIASVANTLVATEDTIAKRRNDLKKFLYGSILGWHDALSNLDASVSGLVDQYGKKAGLSKQAGSVIAQAQTPFILTDTTKQTGVFTVSDAEIDANMTTVAAGGYTATAKDLFDLSILKEVYDEHPDLRAFTA